MVCFYIPYKYFIIFVKAINKRRYTITDISKSKYLVRTKLGSLKHKSILYCRLTVKMYSKKRSYINLSSFLKQQFTHLIINSQ